MEIAAFDAGLPSEERAALEDLRPPLRVAKNGIIYTQGEKATSFYYLQEGRARIFLSSPEGMEKTLTVRESGALLGEAAFFDRMPRTSSARALACCVLVPVDEAALLEAFSAHPRLAAQMLGALARTVRMLSTQVDDISFLRADRRLARLLLQTARPTDDGQCAHCTHEELSLLAGTSRVTVSRVLKNFAAQGWIRTQYRAVSIVNPPALSAFAYEAQED